MRFQTLHSIPPEQDVFRKRAVVHLHKRQDCITYGQGTVAKAPFVGYLASLLLERTMLDC